MIKYLTHKLRTQSLTESDHFQSKPQEDNDRDSGTESDDEGAEVKELQKYMENGIHHEVKRDRHRVVRSPPADTDEPGDTSSEGRQQLSRASKTDVDSPLPESILDSALPSDSDHNFDHHSSEEELEVINCTSSLITRGRSNTYPEKRKWSQANCCSAAENSGSSDDEVRDLMCFSAPVEFCASPPANVHKPSQSLSPPPKVFHSAAANIPAFEVCSVSPRNNSPKKIHRHAATNRVRRDNVQRPCLDFEKMQQKLAKKRNLQMGKVKQMRLTLQHI
ncbi:uncharacterized protein LOC106459147 isoform X1 [Limulus polyphemus]|uniref:Uncharacterized protein LOC106459147 isoform X1 n=2 Tax=Limulus polyphemus TaxID=6850 RepID=A0ABM1SCV0_LIMPO|nr:uncharacterized protein LOC106459147 isoform X1 [Limulus polyphemus]